MEENVNQTEKEMAEKRKTESDGKRSGRKCKLGTDRNDPGTDRTAGGGARKEKGLWNKKAESATKTTKEIVKSNVFTYFNLIF